ncbi:uncharacterized protein EI90DRAFT_3132586 [Cantharellus anzutake]|uniref:uncharacterized protein n=1 Tax=Cantharellus anzutake TaxID=1750568 RepID=UPI001906451F|nr:uncharacterized protein EI90DRAFT_3132586 [Cantharellus anzutake]KAF8319479.1 hypothetical protein EI90DRAFT_3132586 [Cantharellus anzutake]
MVAVKAEIKSEPHTPKVQWDTNERWTERPIEYLTNHLDVRLKMFSDSVKDARKESRKKVVGSKPKVEYYREIAKAVFDVEGEPDRGAYLMEPERYATCLRSDHLKTYTRYRKMLQQTGEGLKDEDEDKNEMHRNQLEMIHASFPWWNTLHGWWSEHPKYAFQMVTNSTSGTGKMVSDFEQAVFVPPEQVAAPIETNTSRPPSPPAIVNALLSHVNSPISWAEPPPQVDMGLLNTDTTLFRMESPTGFPLSLPDSQLPDVKPGINAEDSSVSSSHTLARSTPGPATLKSKVDLTLMASRTSGSKGHKDFIADFHEAARVDQVQAQQEAEYHHVQQMARFELKREKMHHKFEIESLRLQLQLAQVQSQPQQQQQLQQQPQQQHDPTFDFGSLNF